MSKTPALNKLCFCQISIMASSSSPSSSSSSSKYEVFLSFRGEDTRDNFTSHLYAALCQKKIKTFFDEEGNRGGEMWPEILNAIIGSKISVIIFSKDYASSEWCLNELVEILECKQKNSQFVIPVFYHVHPSDVRKQTGNFGKSFIKHQKNFKETPEKVQRWRIALKQASYLSGLESMKIRPEAKLVGGIVKNVLKKLESITTSSNFKGLVGLNSRIEQIKSKLCMGVLDFRIVGIWGMGGIGKTAIAEALFKQISSEFDGKCFMANVREKSERRGGLEHLQKHAFSLILEENVETEGPNLPQYTMERLQRMKVFIVLDDVNNFKELEYLAGEPNRFGLGSRIVVTTRDRSVLDKFGVENVYKVEKFNDNEAFELFCNYAFKQNRCPRDLLVLSKRVVDYAKGNPLALKVLGSSFCQKSKLDWENSLYNLQRLSYPDIYELLKISYDELNGNEKSLFLDIACFFKGEDRDFVTMILDDPNLYSVHHGLSILVNKSLITISDDTLQMHDLLQEIGRKIVCQESEKEPGKRSRLWHHEEVYSVLKRNKGTDAIEGIFLDLTKIREIYLDSRAFANMTNLRLLKFYMSPCFGVSDVGSTVMGCKVHLPQGLGYLSDDLRYLHWHGYPLKTLPSNFSPENLIELNLPYSKIEQLWEGEKEAFKLKFIDLQHSQYFTRIPATSETPNVESLNLLNCTNFLYISPSIQNFNNLSILCLKGCESVRCFPGNVCFTSPIKIDFSHCANLIEFPRISGNIIELDVSWTTIEEVPSLIGCLTNLEILYLEHCTQLKSLPASICKLKSLGALHLGNCSKLERLPEIFDKMEQLRFISLQSTAIKELPSSIEHIEGLVVLILMDCSKLDSLPENLRNLKSLEYIDAERSAIRQLPSSIIDLEKLAALSFSGCRGLVLPLLSGLSSLRRLDLVDCGIMEIPQDIGCISSLDFLDLCGNNFESLPTSIKQLSCLDRLFLSDCSMLQLIPELPICLKILEAKNCKQLQSLPELPSRLEELDASILQMLSLDHNGYSAGGIEFTFANCLNLNEETNNVLADSLRRIQHMIISSLRLYYKKEFLEAPRISICLPGGGIPDWFTNQCSGSLITIQLPQHHCNGNFIGFAICAVIEFEEDSNAGGEPFGVKSRCVVETGTHFDNNFVDLESIDSDHVCLGFDFFWGVRLLHAGHLTAVSFEFFLRGHTSRQIKGHKVKCCGVCPVYSHPNETKPNMFTLKFGAHSEEECSEFRNLHNDIDLHDMANMSGTTGSIPRSAEEEIEPICREQINAPQEQSSCFPQIFCNGGGLLAFLLHCLPGVVDGGSN